MRYLLLLGVLANDVHAEEPLNRPCEGNLVLERHTDPTILNSEPLRMAANVAARVFQQEIGVCTRVELAPYKGEEKTVGVYFTQPDSFIKNKGSSIDDFLAVSPQVAEEVIRGAGIERFQIWMAWQRESLRQGILDGYIRGLTDTVHGDAYIFIGRQSLRRYAQTIVHELGHVFLEDQPISRRLPDGRVNIRKCLTMYWDDSIGYGFSYEDAQAIRRQLLGGSQ